MLASPAPVRAFVCLIRKNMGLDLRCCLGNDAHKTLLYDVDMLLNNSAMACPLSDKTILGEIKCSCVVQISDFALLQNRPSDRPGMTHVFAQCFPL